MNKLLTLKKATASQYAALKDLFSKKIDRYIPSITFLTKYEKKKFQQRCIEKKFMVHMKLMLTINTEMILIKNLFLFILQKNNQKIIK